MLNRLGRGVTKNFLWLLLAVALIHGLIYVFLVPPWQHYDEPGHFEYAWLVANLPRWPQEGDINLEMRREVAASMIRYHFYRGMDNVPDLTANPQDPVFIGISQIQKERLYYFVAAIPLRVFRQADITTQLYIVRLVSLLLFVLTVYFIYRAGCEIFRAGHPLRWFLPLFACLLPPFVDLMTAVNNDVIATACGTLFFWLCIVLIQKGVTWPRLIALAAVCALCITAKDTSAVLSVPLGSIALILGLLHARPRLAWGIAAGAVILALGLAFSWKEVIPANFYSYGESYLPARQVNSQAPVGKYVLAQKSQKNDWNSFYAMIPPDDFTRLRGKMVTLGFWAWATQPVDISVPMLQVYPEKLQYNGSLHLETEPRFYKYAVKLPEWGNLGWFWFFTTQKAGTTLYWNGLVLAEGDYSETASPPQFADTRALAGSWGGQPFRNMIQNGSARAFWPVLRPALGQVIEKMGLTSPYLWSWLDWQNTGWYYRSSAERIFRTFWGRFGWAQVSLSGQKPFRIFVLLNLLSAAGLILWGARRFQDVHLSVVLFLGISCVLALAVVITRGVGSWLQDILFPSARYLYPAILPVSFFICGGWFGWLDRLPNPSKWRNGLVGLGLVALFAYAVWGIYSISVYYYPPGL